MVHAIEIPGRDANIHDLLLYSLPVLPTLGVGRHCNHCEQSSSSKHTYWMWEILNKTVIFKTGVFLALISMIWAAYVHNMYKRRSGSMGTCLFSFSTRAFPTRSGAFLAGQIPIRRQALLVPRFHFNFTYLSSCSAFRCYGARKIEYREVPNGGTIYKLDAHFHHYNQSLPFWGP